MAVPYPRWVPLLLGFVANIAIGMTTYAWSLFIVPLHAEFGWNRAEIALGLSLCCFVCGAVGWFAGKLNDRLGPRPVMLAGALLLGAGFMLTGSVSTRHQMYLTYGVMAGAGTGLLYLPPIALAPRWWPDHKALATGCIVLGLGFGSFIMGPVATAIMQNPALDWRDVFRYCGAVMGVMSLVAGLLLREPPAGFRPPASSGQELLPGGTVHRTEQDTEPHKTAEQDFTHARTVRTPQFWGLYAAFFATTFSGVLVIGHIAAHGTDNGLTAVQASFAVAALALANSATRVISGLCADAMGFRRYFLGLCALQTACLALLIPAGGSAWLLAFLAACVGWNYGSIFTLFPAACAQYFGPSAQGPNYGLLFTSWGLAGLCGPWIGGVLKDVSGSYTAPFLLAGAMSLIPVVIMLRIRPPRRGAEQNGRGPCTGPAAGNPHRLRTGVF